MGSLSAGHLSILTLSMSRLYQIQSFVETGTFRGETTRWAAGVFASVKSIEMHDATYAQACLSLADLPNVELFHGDSASTLAQIVPSLTEPTIFWLDAHSGGGNFGSEDYCPLLDEIAAIRSSRLPHILLIDDARAFLAPPPPPFIPERWPGLSEVILALNQGQPCFTMTLCDAIIAAPPETRPLLTNFSAAVRPKI